MKIRVRIPPSPTGYLHVGTARTALFNYLFARHHGGASILRIEDTDLERSEAKYEKDIIDSLRWLGVQWDEGPYKQSERSAIYEKYITNLLQKQLAYYCYCSKEELETERGVAAAKGLSPKYSGKCRNLNLPARDNAVIRLKTPEKKIKFTDLIRGEIEFDSSLMGDIVIAKNLKIALYNLAVVIDDEEMKITHVIRGEDHIANTPKQILLQEALGFSQPQYAHLPLLLDKDRSKLSKRYAATGINEYREDGYLPEALINYLALLGWHPEDEQEIMNLEELVAKFDLKRVQKAGAVFDIEKLKWLNSHYLRQLSEEQIIKSLDWPLNPQNLKIVRVLKDRCQTLKDFKTFSEFFFKLPDYEASLLIWKKMTEAEVIKSLETSSNLIAQDDIAAIKNLAEKEGRGEVLWPLRVALSGLKGSPDPLEIIDVLGKEESLKRIAIALNKLKQAK